MPFFELTLRNASDPGKPRVLVVESSNSALATSENSSGDWFVTSAKEVSAPSAGLFGRRRTGLIGGKRLITMCKAMGAMLRGGLKLEDALDYYARGLTDRDLATVLQEVRRGIEKEGEDPHTAFEKTGRFDPQFLAIVAAASESSSIGSGFRRIADRLQQGGQLTAGLVRELSMPILALCILIVVFVSSQYGVTRTMDGIVQTMHLTPGPVLGPAFALGRLTRNYWPFAAMGLAMFTVCMVFVSKFRNGFVDFFVRRSKVVRNMVTGLRQLAILNTMDLLLNCYGPNAGLGVAAAMKAAAKVATGTRYEPELMEAYRQYQDHGVPLGVALEENTTLDRQITHLIGVGEPTSTVGVQVTNLIDMYNDLTRDAIELFQRVVVIFVLVTTAVLIMIVAVSVVFPLVLLGPQMSGGGIK